MVSYFFSISIQKTPGCQFDYGDKKAGCQFYKAKNRPGENLQNECCQSWTKDDAP